MSSATSIENGVPEPDAIGRAADVTPPVDAPVHHGFQPWHFFLLASLVAATAAVVMSRRTSPVHLNKISLVIASAGLAAAGFYRMLAPLVSDEPVSGAALSDRTRAALEREKILTLRSIKELEFDRAMGKISAKDFDEIAARLRARAIALMRELDSASSDYRTEIEQQLQTRLGRRAASRMPIAADAVRCPSCGTGNDSDAAFCKRCGARIEKLAPQQP